MMWRPVIGWVGNYRRIEKRFDMALHVCNKYEYRLRVAGPTHTILHYDHSDMPHFYRGIDLLLVTSKVEAHPLAVYEALACATPVVMSKTGDCESMDVKGINYFYYYPDLEKTSEAIMECIEKTLLSQSELGKAGREHILQHWQWKHWIPKYVAMFQTVTGMRKGIRLAITVDKPEWAWDIMAKILTRELMKTGCFKDIDVVYTRGIDWLKTLHIRIFDPSKYDVILNHCWQEYNHRTFKDFPHELNIPCANGYAYLDGSWKKVFNSIIKYAPAITTVSNLIAKDLQKRFDKPVFYCSRGVDTELFKP
ncbi:MAG: glycosyltransferase [Candidatus Bathyarchaeota archaeon]